MNLLPDYRISDEEHFVRLIAPNGADICVFGEHADPREIERECFEHAARVDFCDGETGAAAREGVVSNLRLFYALYRGYYAVSIGSGIRRHLNALRLACRCMADKWRKS